MLTTQLRQIKSYPTYQLHAYTRSSSSAAEDMFRICILETRSNAKVSATPEIKTQT